jgi:V/A-type H+-transporting ATPase subunit E
MQNKLQELTEKIYHEGLEKGNAEAKTIVDSAHEEAKSIVDSAKKEAQKLIDEAQKKAEETKANTETEIKLSSKQALNALKQQITDVVNSEVVGKAISNTFDKDFTKKIVEITLKNWATSQSSNLNIILPKESEKELNDYFKKSVKDLLDKGLDFKFDNSIKSGFQITPKDGSYKVSFTEEDFASFFKQYLRPKLVEQLFQD